MQILCFLLHLTEPSDIISINTMISSIEVSFYTKTKTTISHNPTSLWHQFIPAINNEYDTKKILKNQLLFFSTKSYADEVYTSSDKMNKVNHCK